MEPITNETLLRTRFLGRLQASPGRSRYAFVASQADWKANTYTHDLYIGDEQGVRRLRSLKENSAFLFTDEETLLLDLQKNQQERDALKQQKRKSIYRYRIPNKTLEHAFTLPFPAQLEASLPGGRLLLSAQLRPSDHILYTGEEEARKRHLEQLEEAQAYETIERLPYYMNGAGFIHETPKQLLIREADGSYTPLQNPDFAVGTFALSEDREVIYFAGSPLETVRTPYAQIHAYEASSGRRYTLYDRMEYSVERLFELEGRILALAKDMRRYGLNENPDFYLVEDGALKLSTRFGENPSNTIGTDCRLLPSPTGFVHEGAYFFVATIDDHSEIKRFTLENGVETDTVMDGSVDGLVRADNHRILIGMQGQSLQEIYALEEKTDTFRRLTALNEEVLAGHYVAAPRPLVVEGEDHTVKGFVLLPADYSPKTKHPAILNIHGGPKTVYGRIFYHEMQLWASRGYVVMFANPRGSDGKGDAFADIRGRYGTIDYEDLMAFVDEVKQTYRGVDADRLFVTGGSYGGFMTNWMLGRTRMFKAAATQRSIADWRSFHGTSDIGYLFAADQTAGHPIHDAQALAEQSPLMQAQNIDTPTLIIHADQDYRCPIEQAQQLFAILKERGVPSRLVWFKGETHELSRSGKPKARMKRLDEITGWFDAYAWEKS